MAAGAGEGPEAVAFVTLCVSISHLPGLDALLFSIRCAMGTQWAIKVITVSQVAASGAFQSVVKAWDAEAVEVDEHLDRAKAALGGAPPATHGAGWDVSSLCKLALFDPVAMGAVERCVYLDADAVLLQPATELLTRPLLPGPVPLAAPDVFPPDRFNAGVMVVRPCREAYETLMAHVPEWEALSYDGGDTGFLNALWGDEWFQDRPETPATSISGAGSLPPSASRRLPFRFNAQRTLLWMTGGRQPRYWHCCRPIVVLHMSSSPKPWDLPSATAGARPRGPLEHAWIDLSARARLTRLESQQPGGPAAAAALLGPAGGWLVCRDAAGRPLLSKEDPVAGAEATPEDAEAATTTGAAAAKGAETVTTMGAAAAAEAAGVPSAILQLARLQGML